MSKELIKAAIDKFPALAAMYTALGKDKQEKFAAEIGAIYKESNPSGVLVKEEKPRTQLIIYYPDNFWTNKVHLKVNGSFVGVYLLRDDIDFRGQVKIAAQLRGIEITQLEYTESKKLITTINDEPIIPENFGTNNPVDTKQVSTSNSPSDPPISLGNDKQRNDSQNNTEGTGNLFDSPVS